MRDKTLADEEWRSEVQLLCQLPALRRHVFGQLPQIGTGGMNKDVGRLKRHAYSLKERGDCGFITKVEW